MSGPRSGKARAALRVLLDGRPVKTPARRPLAAPTLALAEALAAEWQAQRDVVDPAKMPLTRLANSIIDGVADAPDAVAAEVEKYLASDLVLYRAEAAATGSSRGRPPPGIRCWPGRARLWAPVSCWRRGWCSWRSPQPRSRRAARAIPRDPWRLGAFHVVTTLTGSALIALAVLRGRLTAEEAWAAAHVDEDWNMEFWGRDELALERRALRCAEMQAAAWCLRTAVRPTRAAEWHRNLRGSGAISSSSVP